MNDPRFTPGTCINCGSSRVAKESPLFCDPRCQEMAKHIRYIRRCRRDGRWLDPAVRDAIRTRIALLLGGGYPQNLRRVGGELRTKVFQRAGGRCEQCGRPLDFDGTSGDLGAQATIQHVSGSSNDHSNLKAFCRRCNVADAQSRFTRIQPGSKEEEVLALIRRRCESAQPLRLCDDENQWPVIWRNLQKEARNALSS